MAECRKLFLCFFLSVCGWNMQKLKLIITLMPNTRNSHLILMVLLIIIAVSKCMFMCCVLDKTVTSYIFSCVVCLRKPPLAIFHALQFNNDMPSHSCWGVYIHVIVVYSMTLCLSPHIWIIFVKILIGSNCFGSLFRNLRKHINKNCFLIPTMTYDI